MNLGWASGGSHMITWQRKTVGNLVNSPCFVFREDSHEV